MRLLQSFGGGGIFIFASSHIISTYSKNKQGSMLGLLGAMNGIASVIGPNVGSFLIDITGTWHWLFLINVPIGIILVIFGWKFLQETKDAVWAKIDFLGISLLSFSILTVMLGVNNLGSGGFTESLLSWGVLGFLLRGTAFFTIFLVVEKRNESGDTIDPILPYSLLKKKTYSMTMVMALLSGTFIGAVIFIPSFAQQILGVSAAKSAYWMTPLALASGIGAGGGGYFVDKQGPVKTIILAGIISIIGFGSLAFFTTTKLAFIIFTVIAGIGFGFVLGAPLTVLTSNTAKTQKGSAIGTLSVSRQIGLTIAPTIFGAFIQNGFSKLRTIISLKLQEYGVDTSNISDDQLNELSSGTYSDLESKISSIPDPGVQKALLVAFDEAAHQAYIPIYLFTTIMAAVMIIIAISFNKQFRGSLIKNHPWN